MKRREFLKKGATLIGAVIVGGRLVSEVKQSNEIKIIHKPDNTNIGMLDEGGYYLPRDISDAIARELKSASVLRKHNV